MNERSMNPTVTLGRKDFATEEDWQRAIREVGTFNLRGGIRVYVTVSEEVDLDYDWGPSVPLVAEVSVSDGGTVEVTDRGKEVTFHADGSYSRRLT